MKVYKDAGQTLVDGVGPGNPMPVTGSVAEDAPLASGAPGMPTLGQRVPAAPAVQTSAVGDAGFIAITSDGKQVISGSGAEEHTFQGPGATITNSTTSTAIKAAAAAGIRNYITDLLISNRHSAAVDVTIMDGVTAITQPILLPPGSTVVLNFSTPLRGSAASAINAVLSAAVAGSVSISPIGYLGV